MLKIPKYPIFGKSLKNTLPPGLELLMEDFVISGLKLPRIPPPTPRIGTSRGRFGNFGSEAAKNTPF